MHKRNAISPSGRFRNTAVSFDEVGVVQLQASIADGDYLSAGNVLGSLSGNVGRFYVDNFTLNNSSFTASCNNFSYMDQNTVQLLSVKLST